MTSHSLTNHREGAFAALRKRIGGLLGVIAETSDLMRSSRNYERLSRLSDEELGRRGLRRDRLIEHAFQRYVGL